MVDDGLSAASVRIQVDNQCSDVGVESFRGRL